MRSSMVGVRLDVVICGGEKGLRWDKSTCWEFLEAAISSERGKPLKKSSHMRPSMVGVRLDVVICGGEKGLRWDKSTCWEFLEEDISSERRKSFVAPGVSSNNTYCKVPRKPYPVPPEIPVPTIRDACSIPKYPRVHLQCANTWLVKNPVCFLVRVSSPAISLFLSKQSNAEINKCLHESITIVYILLFRHELDSSSQSMVFF
ncbi:hypothetical protein L6452_34179 [Arctium lappa]|uniref:Uncharacterized protein n=1 Tax=Arctium lappa TaxID=4217 RepID=A0ACB8YHH9_ARCLA|nr:hypothetical protein L6452_34179 [Arctium lappa]